MSSLPEAAPRFLDNVRERDDNAATRKRFACVHGLVEFVGSPCKHKLSRVKIDDDAEIGVPVEGKRETCPDHFGASIVPDKLRPPRIQRVDKQSDNHRLDDRTFAVQAPFRFSDDLLRRPVLPRRTCDASELERVCQSYDPDAVRRVCPNLWRRTCL